MLSAASRAGGAGLKAVFAGMKVFQPDRPIHRHGVVLEGTLTRTRVFSGEDWIDMPGEETVLARISRSIGLPDFLPDIAGMALRIGNADVLLSTTGHGLPGRFVLRPRRSVVDGPFTSLMPFRGVGGPVVLAARREGPGPELDRLEELRGFESELQFGIYYSRLRGPWTRFGTLCVTVSETQDESLRFHPVHRAPARLGLYEWTRNLRVPSYALAQRRSAWLHFEKQPVEPESDPWKPTTRFPRRIRSRRI